MEKAKNPNNLYVSTFSIKQNQNKQLEKIIKKEGGSKSLYIRLALDLFLKMRANKSNVEVHLG